MDVIDLGFEHGGAHDHLVITAVQSAQARHLRLDTDGESLERPERCAEYGKDRPRRRHPTEDRAHQPAESAGDIGVKDVRELVRDDEIDPVAGVLQLEIVYGGLA